MPARAAEVPVLRVPHPFSGSRLLIPNPATAGDAKRTAVVMLHGSEGGSAWLIKPEADLIASQGYAVLVLCYFDCNRGLTGPRQTLRDIDVSLIPRAISWLREQPWSNGAVALYGFSRGAELALIAGSLEGPDSERPSALIAHSPSDLYNSYFNWSWREPACWLCPLGPGRCPGSVPQPAHQWNDACGPDNERRMDFSRSAWIVDGLSVPAGRRIAVEDISLPTLITVGEEDQTWSPDQTRRIESRMRAAGRDPEVHYFPGAGHVFGGDDENRRRSLVLTFLARL
ncbi:MAG: dienelactone hydrolase family protein [Bryobacterales bacterium]|nr:dienelactone hydrolase family protein [Bryobacterales bacterium]